MALPPGCVAFTNTEGQEVTTCLTSGSKLASSTPPSSEEALPQQTTTSRIFGQSADGESTTSTSPTGTLSETQPVQETTSISSSTGVFSTTTSPFAFGPSTTSHTVLTSSTGKPGNSTDLGQTSKPTSSSNSVSAGAAAGIAIATAIVGALIALLVAFLLYRRRHSRDELSTSRTEPQYRPPSALTGFRTEKGGIALWRKSATSSGLDLTSLTGTTDFLAGVLPQAADDRTVRDRLSLLFDQMQLHVENFYSDSRAPTLSSAAQSALARFGPPTLAEPLPALLGRSTRPTAVIAHTLTYYLLDAALASTGERSLLPVDMAVLPARVARADQSVMGSRDFTASYILWRRLTANIHKKLDSSNNSVQSQNALVVAQTFSQTFAPWANTQKGKDENMLHVIRSAVEVMMMLYEQPFLYEFDWAERAGAPGTIVVAPGLKKTTDGQGRRLGSPQVLLKPSITQI